ncbi:MAG TPA: tetratricopeptide repeat protein [Gammaproteobacteria bacterium]|nr:tetratricopeptide repeat protein [Gammaproteobacteria bacterium]
MLFDYRVAFETSKAEAEKGDPAAQYKLGVMYGLGLGVQQDYAEAVRWYRRAARSGDARSQSNLGFMYGTGRGVPQDYIQAYAWYNVASASGEDTARYNRDALAGRMSAGQIEKAQKLSAELFHQINKAST